MNRSGQIFTLFALIAVIGLPFLLRKERPVIVGADDRVIVITPHPESIRQEFARGFSRWYEEQTGRTVYVDYRVIGGTSEIARFLDSEYSNAFRNHWVNDLGRRWTSEIQQNFNNRRLQLPDNPDDDTPAQAARRAFLTSSVSSGIDVFFGGGTYDFSLAASKGNLVNAGLRERHPDWFQDTAEPGTIPDAIPMVFAGETYFDPEGRWYGSVLSSYGIIYNRPSLRRLGIEQDPRHWWDLADPRLFGQVAVCDPTKSGSMTQAFEMIIQQQMQMRLAELIAQSGYANPDPDTLARLESIAVTEGWDRGMRLIQIISANARYFTDSSQKPNIDVANGDCAAGMSIDFFGRFQQENIIERSGSDRFGFHTPVGGSTISADPIGLLRGARNRDVAERFIEYVLSIEGQKLWNFRVGVQGGPEIFALRRPPIRPELYLPEFNHLRSDPDYNPFLESANFTYRRDWTGALFSQIRIIIRIAFIDVRNELVDAWGSIIQARNEGRHHDADAAEAILTDLSRISLSEAQTTIADVLRGRRIEEVRFARELSSHFRQQYRAARDRARGLPVDTAAL